MIWLLDLCNLPHLEEPVALLQAAGRVHQPGGRLSVLHCAHAALALIYATAQRWLTQEDASLPAG